jgi:ribosomal protein S8
MSKELLSEITELKERIRALETVLKSYGFLSEFQPIKAAAIALGVSDSKLRKMIRESRLNPRKSPIKIGTHYSFNGNRILINVKQWERDILVIAPENR